MKTVLKDQFLILIPESEAESQGLAAGKARCAGHLLVCTNDGGFGLALKDLGPRVVAREGVADLGPRPDEFRSTVLLRQERLFLAPEEPAVNAALIAWQKERDNHVFVAARRDGGGMTFKDLGHRKTACAVPINITSRSPSPTLRLIANFAATPFELDGQQYASVESFWQCLKSDDPAERRRIAGLSGRDAKRAGRDRSYGATVVYDGRQVPVGAWEHWQLMERACWAKFTQHPEARRALQATGRRPLTHRLRRDSRTIPGVIMANIWMRLRRRLPPADDRVMFFARDRKWFGFLSNFHPAPLELDGESWPTAEHYYQAQKSFDPAYRQAIRAADTPAAAKRLAAAPGQVTRAPGQSWFVQNGQEPRADWPQVKLALMRRVVQAKFAQNPKLAARLLATGTAALIEDSPADSFWGIGRDAQGQNWLGQILMAVRQELRTPPSIA